MQLRDLWSSDIAKDSAATTTAGARIDVVPWLNRMTLDVIGLAGKLDVACRGRPLTTLV